MTTKQAMGQELERLLDGLVLASDGIGPLLQRDYWAVIHNSRVTAPELAELLATDFCQFAPDELVQFETEGGDGGTLKPGDHLEVRIRMAGPCQVRVVHRDANSLTLATVKGHPEAGRITFGAYPNEKGDIIFHIRSRARSSTRSRYAGFLTVGEPMQTNTWTDFVDRVAHTVGDGVIGVIHAETKEIEDEPQDPMTICSPTFVAVGE